MAMHTSLNMLPCLGTFGCKRLCFSNQWTGSCRLAWQGGQEEEGGGRACLRTAKRDNGQQAATAALDNRADHVYKALLATLSRQVPRHTIRGLHDHCSIAERTSLSV